MRIRPGLAALLLLTASVALADVTEIEEHRFTLKDGGRFSLDNINGDTVIEGVDGNEVFIKATKKAGSQEYLDGLEVQIDASDSSVQIETRHPKGNWFKWGKDGSGSVSYEVRVPRAMELDSIESVNGRVHISGVTGAVKASTVNGELDLDDLGGDARLETVNGGIEAQFDRLEGNQRVSVDAVNGTITLHLPAETSARVTAETLNGSIKAADFGLEVVKGMVGRDLQGDIGSGEARIDIDTVNGSIRLNKIK